MTQNVNTSHLEKIIGNLSESARKNIKSFERSENLIITEIGDGNINYIFRVQDSDTNFSVIAKYADDFIRNSETKKLSTKRSEIEFFILDVQNKLAPNFVPKVYFFDNEQHCIYMEDLTDFKTMRDALKEKAVFPHFAENIATFLYNTLFKTTDLVMESALKKRRATELLNIDMCEISERLVFTEPYKNLQNLNVYHQNNKDLVSKYLYQNESLITEVAKLKNNFKNNAQSMIHGDLHSGSIFINESHIKVFDPEFSFYGPMGYDIGNILGNLTINYVIEKVIKGDEDFTNWLAVTVSDIVDNFIEIYNQNFKHDVTDPMMKHDTFQKAYLEEILSDTFGYAGTEIIRRTVGAFKVPKLGEVLGSNHQEEIEKRLITIGSTLIQRRHEFKNGKSFLTVLNNKEVLI